MSAQVAQRPPAGAAGRRPAAAPPRHRPHAHRRARLDSRGGMWAWLLQRVTAVVLIVGLLTHLVATHIFNLGHLSYLEHRRPAGLDASSW